MALLKIEDHAGLSLFPSLSGARRWVVTFIATIVSTYALDAIATATGILLVTSHILQGLDHVVLLLFLACTYVLWGLGLRVNLKANWMLLEETGTSTNVLSKAACDLVKARTRSVGARKIAAAVGYVGTELAKEAPYYVGAFGVVLLTDSVSANEAIIFLGGANLGAAAYEYGLARVVRVVLHRQDGPAYASFDTDWVPRDYLRDYYSVIEPDEHRTIEFFVDAIKEAEPNEPMLYFGVGPTLHHVFLAARTASEIHLGDYLPANLQEIERWMNRDPDAHDWHPFVRYTLECEGLASPRDDEITQREELARARITRLLEVDIRRVDPLGEQNTPQYGTVISAYCVDSLTEDRDTWETYMERIAGLVRPGGTLLTAALRRSRGYLVGDKKFPSANVDEHDMREVLERYFCREDLTIEVCELAEVESKGYSSVVLARAHHRGSRSPQMARTGVINSALTG
ncbi:hypothetical protein LHFGNBLO_000040 [Mesorhizobium sp. AR10]|uniref:guanitoxin biosynthesis pre-guanitoxin forming N-methyltransferase GntF n=1 Tax=Mesorhizobium sp. AR10 TaxID=2865839 RepID=UPI00215F56E8|nr:guanitoxin biosynthesis pre-guanitoxin forming N-methyltransferase GntF [Mesorhizobium sp. AR10]UVK38759.1 hypothetical protein LHFGNBLO_000040 [Mesorhizobium sp. AR10]